MRWNDWGTSLPTPLASRTSATPQQLHVIHCPAENNVSLKLLRANPIIAEQQLLALDSRHFYEILVPGLEVWQKEHIIHTQNNCIKIALRVWLPLKKT